MPNGAVELAERLARLESCVLSLKQAVERLVLAQGQQHKEVTEALNAVQGKMHDVEIVMVETHASFGARISTVERDVTDLKALKREQRVWDGANSIGALIAGVIASLPRR